MHGRNDCSNEELALAMDGLHSGISRGQRQLFRLIVEAERRAMWRDSGARDLAAWLSIRYGISDWKARRWIAAAHALERLPRISQAFSSGELGMPVV